MAHATAETDPLVPEARSEDLLEVDLMARERGGAMLLIELKPVLFAGVDPDLVKDHLSELEAELAPAVIAALKNFASGLRAIEEADLAAARQAKADVKAHGSVSLEHVKKELGL